MRVAATLAVVAGLCAVTPARADRAARERADKLFEDGRRYLEKGEYSLACTAFEQSQEAEPAIGTQLNIALCYEKASHPAKAYEAYREAERMARAAGDRRADGARKRTLELEAKIGRVRFVLPPDADPFALVLLDGAELAASQRSGTLVLDAGTHVVEVRVAGAPPTRHELVVVAGSELEVPLDVPARGTPAVATPSVVERRDAPPPVAMRRTRSGAQLAGGIGLVIGGAAALGYASYVALDARSDYRAAFARCPGGRCSAADFTITQDARDRARSMTWVFGGGLAAATLGTVLVVTSGRTEPASRLTVAPMLAPGVAGLALGGAL